MEKVKMNTMQKVNIRKDHFLENSNDGLDFYEHVIGKLNLVHNNRCENVCSPFYRDTNPSFSIFFHNEKWKYKDYGNPEDYGDVFKFAATHYAMDVKLDFWQILEKMYDDLGIDKPCREIEVNKVVYDLGYLFKQAHKEKEEGRKKAHEYFRQFGITADVLKRFNVWCPASYVYVNKYGELKEWYSRKDELTIAYEDINHTKFYQPFSDKFKFLYRGNKPDDFIFGQRQVIRDMIKTKRWVRDILIITSGEKDVLTLTSLGYDAVCLNSETATTIPQQFEDSILGNYRSIVVLYDLDSTGKKCADELKKRYTFKVCTLPGELKERGGKDVSDYVKLGLNIEKLRTLISESEKQTVNWIGNIDGKIRIIKISNGYVNNKKEVVSFDAIVEEVEEVSIIDQVGQATNGDDYLAEQIDETADNLTTPFLPTSLFDKLPHLLKDICKHFPDKRERDLVFLSSIGIISSVIPTVKSINSGRLIGANLNLFISAPAASGKGVANWAREIGSGIQKHVKEEYEKELTLFKAANSADREQKESDDEFEKPVRKSLFIPANTSISKMIEMLDANGNFGIMFETEGDTLTGALKTEWGNFSEVIRKCFHHETVSLARRGNDEHLEIEKPHLSLVLTGTPDQLPRLIDTVENGFFSRFFFYDFQNEVAWKSQFARQDNSLLDFFKQVSETMLQIWLGNQSASDSLMLFNQDQIRKVDKFFASKQKSLNSIYGKDILASVNRSCIICQRFCMILTALRFLETNKKLPERLYFDDEDLNISLALIDTLLSHLEVVFSRMRTSDSTKDKLNSQQKKVFDLLPEQFSWKAYCTIVEELELPFKTGEKYLRDFRKLDMVKRGEKHGQYIRLVE